MYTQLEEYQNQLKEKTSQVEEHQEIITQLRSVAEHLKSQLDNANKELTKSHDQQKLADMKIKEATTAEQAIASKLQRTQDHLEQVGNSKATAQLRLVAIQEEMKEVKQKLNEALEEVKVANVSSEKLAMERDEATQREGLMQGKFTQCLH